MRLSVKNLGPLKEAEVDLSQPLIILTGPNNTGKTWFSWCVYGVQKSGAGGAKGRLIGTTARDILSEDGADVSLLIQQNHEHVLAQIASETWKNLPLLFASEPELFAQTELALIENSGPTNIIPFLLSSEGLIDAVWITTASDPQEELIVMFHITKSRVKLTWDEWDDERGSDIESQDVPKQRPIAQLSEESRERATQAVQQEIFSIMAQTQCHPCTIFPAERIAVNIFARELSLKRSKLVDDMLELEGTPHKAARQAAILASRARRYPWPIRDSLHIADDLAANSREQSKFADLATDLETSVMGGKIGISKQGDMTFSPTQAPERALGIHLTASVVKSLSSLVFYFRYLAKAGDFLIIDEPELNLHPDNQRRVARVLAKAVNRGFKIMLSTHSDCLIREFNHLIMLSQDSDVARELRQEFGYEDSSLLTPEKVGVYLFNEDHATPIPVREDGFEVKTIDDEINKMNFVTQSLYVRLFD